METNFDTNRGVILNAAYAEYFAGQLPFIGRAGQESLILSQAAVVGVGKLGATAALALHAAGVGRLVLVDPERVEAEQLGPMWFLRRDQIGVPRVQAVADLLKYRPYGQVETVMKSAEAPEVTSVIRRSQVVLCCGDTMSARLAIERRAIAQRVPVLQVAALGGRERWGGIITVHRPETRGGGCCECLAQDQPGIERPSGGLFTTVTALVATFAAHIATLIVCDPTSVSLEYNAFFVDGVSGTIEPRAVSRREGCAKCISQV